MTECRLRQPDILLTHRDFRLCQSSRHGINPTVSRLLNTLCQWAALQFLCVEFLWFRDLPHPVCR